MTEFVFESNDGSEWTEEEKAMAIKRHQAIEKLARERWEIARSDLIMKHLFKEDENGGLPLIKNER